MADVRVQVFDRQHMADFLERRVHDENAANDKNAGGKVHAAFYDSGIVEHEKRFRQRVDQTDHGEQQLNSQSDSDNIPPKSNRLLLGNGRALGINGNIRNVVEPQNRLKEAQHH